MTFKEWSAAIALAAQVPVTIWLINDAMNAGPEAWATGAVAIKLLWAIGGMVAFNVVGVIVVAIGVGIVRREAFKDDRADERDKAVFAKSMRNGYLTLSIGALGALVYLATGADPVLGVYALFAAMMLAGAAQAVSQLVYYRIG